MKSLGSFLDGFREIARNATQMASSSEARRPARPRPDASSVPRGLVDSAPCSSGTHPRPSTACLLPATPSNRDLVRPLPAQLQQPRTSLRHHDLERSDQCSSNQPGPSTDIGQVGRPVSVLTTEQKPSRTNRIDFAAVFDSKTSKVVHLPSSPLPGWTAFDSSKLLALDESVDC